ncbi:MAG: hypothetical protein KC615_01755 [Anaerolineae bacterium]|nr:hypothetical protein [Anaerolineae bacterium]MCA9891675.1 hypothetical protein [Anaerolineae bacterium]
MNDVHMEPARVRAMAERFSGFSTTLKVVAGILEAQMMILKTTAFIGLVGSAAVERYLAALKPQIEEMSRKCEEISQDMQIAVRAWEEAQQSG